MRVDTGLAPRDSADPPVALTIGNFDGVHRGHAALLEELDRAAQAAGATTAVLTFDPHPRCVLDPAHCPPSLTTGAEKGDLLARCGVDRMVVLPFTRDVSRWSAEHFCDLLRETFDLRALVVGHDFALGHKRQGDVAFLRDYGRRHGIEVIQVGEVRLDTEDVSSSRIRQLVQDGGVAAAAQLLGRPYFADARIENGGETGRGLGYPTIDLLLAAEKCSPAPGVYAMMLRVGDEWRMAASNVSYRPMFGGDRYTFEAFVIDGADDLGGRAVRALFIDRVREERSYASGEELVAQIRLDVDAVRRTLEGLQPPDL